MSGLTFIVSFLAEGAVTNQFQRWIRREIFVAPTWDGARLEANRMRAENESIVSLEISEPQRLLDPELDHTKMRDDDPVFGFTWEDVRHVAKANNLPSDLVADEMQVFNTCVGSGMSCWEEVVKLALMAATSERSG